MAAGKEILEGLKLIGSQDRTYLFVPADGKDMKVEYPELAAIPEFNILSNDQLAFVWWVANRTSPLEGKNDDSKKIRLALEYSGLVAKLDQSQISDYYALRFPPAITNAISKMRTFSPSVRMRAKAISEKLLRNLEIITDISEEELKVMDTSQKNSYASLAKNVVGVMDELIASTENAYGIKEKYKTSTGKGDGAAGPTIMDRVIQAG